MENNRTTPTRGHKRSGGKSVGQPAAKKIHSGLICAGCSTGKPFAEFSNHQQGKGAANARCRQCVALDADGQRTMTTYTIHDSQLQERNGSNGKELWVVVDCYVLDLTTFVQHHPGSVRKIIQKRNELGPDITSNFMDHFGHTVRAFREACQQYDSKQVPVTLRFPETGTDVEVVVIGKVKN